MRFAEFLERFVYTRKCAICNELLPYERKGEAFCYDCAIRWSVAKTKECSRCGRSFCECVCMAKPITDSGALCHHKLVAYSSGEPVVHNPIMFIKRNKNPRVAAFFASQLWSVLLSDKDLPELSAKEAVICVVPRGKRAVLEYGFDQSELVATELSRRSGIELVRAIMRRRGGKVQKRLNVSERVKNAKKLFEVNPSLMERIRGKNVILVDDVVTSGASMAACVKLLLRNRARTVVCLSIASTELKK